MEKLTFFFDKEVQKLINSFIHLFKTSITVFSTEMQPQVHGLDNKECNYCNLIWHELKAVSRCMQQDRLMCTQCENRQTALVYQCHAGLTEAVIPIHVKNVLAGYFMIGKFRTQKVIPPEILEEWRKKKLDTKLLKAAFNAQPFFDKNSAENMLNLFSMLCSYIVSNEHVKARNPSIAEQVTRWIEDHISEPVSLDDLAYHLDLSQSTISHTIKKQLRISFRELYILKKIQHFENLIVYDPSISIKDAAYQVGYDDPAYFSRLYKKVRLVPPSEFITSVRYSQH